MPTPRTLVDVVGPKTAKALGRLNIASVEDLLRHYPRRYARRGELSNLASLRVGETVTVFAEVQSSRSRPLKQRGMSMLEVVVTDGTGRLSLTFFRQAWREKHLTAGRRGMFSGKVTEFRGIRQLAHPEYVLAPFGDDIEPEAVAAFANEIIPIYPASASLPSWRVAACVELALPHAAELIDPVPQELRQSEDMPDLATALTFAHRPTSDQQISSAIAKLKFDEAFVLQAEMLRRRAENRCVAAISRNRATDGLLTRFDASIPFPMTGSQVRVGEEIFADLSRTHPMQRLLQGEVGSGKTLVALRAMLAVVDSGGQAAMLAPTEVLASQHFDSIRSLLGPLSGEGIVSAPGTVTVTLLTGSMSTSARRQALLEIQSGSAGIVVGTHALIQDAVGFADLGLVVVDEQHRFGVEQRARLLEKAGGMRPHQLVMTATPIPRTVAMTVFSDLDVSTLDELPPGRAPISTHVVSAAEQPHHMTRVWERIREEVALGRKAYVVCPQIGEMATPKKPRPASSSADVSDVGDADVLQRTSAVELFERLSSAELADLRVGLLHGRQRSDEKDATMRRFAASATDSEALDVLVSTTVVEVGVDVPTASVMVIMDADVFGVSQLHQLRGRVGRGGLPGLCLLITQAHSDAQSAERLQMVASTMDGFALSEYDLTVRREGDVLGADQSGRTSSLRLLQVLADQDIVLAAREAAARILDQDPGLNAHSPLRQAMDRLNADAAEYLAKS